jgi:hypothetical protein
VIEHWAKHLVPICTQPPIVGRPWTPIDAQVIQELVVGDCYQLDNWPINGDGDGETILDIGAHIGVFSALAASR